MSQLPIYLYGSDVLRKKTRRISDVSDKDIKLIQDMFETMRESNGIGLAANQVGVLKQILVVDIADTDNGQDAQPLTVINPEIIEEEGEWEMEEGCLSIPEIRDTVKRSEVIRLKYNDVNMKECHLEASGLLARVLLHEIDHLNGILFIDHLSATKRALLRSKLRRIAKGETETKYPVKIEKSK